jgi:Uma2 family endonuclease
MTTTISTAHPEIAVEILSPSNTAWEMVEKPDLRFTSGCLEFWIIDPKKRSIEVTPANASPRVYRDSERITIGAASCSVDEILG